jgi:pimeloyl-ACP methyl ester carboxylesterase
MPATPSVREQVITLPPEGAVVAIATHPRRVSDRPPIIFLNAGVLHRIGPHRQHVELARRFAGRDVAALRIDLAGIGDSPPHAEADSFRDSAIADTRAAMDALGAELGATQFVLFGLCSGADNALATAAVDPRVVGVVALDPPAYASRRARLRKVAAMVPAWLARGELVERVVALARRRVGRASEPPDDAAGNRREIPERAAHGEQLAALTERGVRILAIYTGVLGERYNHPAQLFEHYPALRGRVEIGYFPEANHSFTERAAQAALSDLVVGWYERQFRAPLAPARAG